MRSMFTLCVFLLCLVACSRDASLYDAKRAARSEVVVKAVLLEEGQNCDKYCWHRFAIVRVFKGESQLEGKKELSIAARSSAEAPPSEECTLYLERHGAKNLNLWMLLDGWPR